MRVENDRFRGSDRKFFKFRMNRIKACCGVFWAFLGKKSDCGFDSLAAELKSLTIKNPPQPLILKSFSISHTKASNRINLRKSVSFVQFLIVISRYDESDKFSVIVSLYYYSRSVTRVIFVENSPFDQLLSLRWENCIDCRNIWTAKKRENRD